MKTTFGEGLALRAQRWSLSTLAVAALVLGAPAVGRAQTPSAGAKSAQRTSPPAAQKAAKPSASNGMNTGIKVHGHWTINILTKDGKLVSHHEFENSLAYGAPILSNLLGGNATPGGMAILLGGSVCPGPGLNTLSGFSGTCPIVVAGSAMALSSPVSASVTVCSPILAYICEGVNGVYNYPVDDNTCGSNALACSTTLNVTSSTGSSGGYAAPSLTLSGTYTAPSSPTQGGSISAVAVTGYVCASSVTYATCVSPPTSGGSVPVLAIYASYPPFTGYPYGASLEGSTLPITETPISPAINVGAGQIIQATVVISFS